MYGSEYSVSHSPFSSDLIDGCWTRCTRVPSLRMIFCGGTRNHERMAPQTMSTRKPI